jgi:hypothetical protein
MQIGLNKSKDRKMNDRKIELGNIKATLSVEQRADFKHSAVRNHDKFDPLADHFSVF